MEDTKPKVFVFVLMPFADAFDDVYEVGIEQACRDAGAYCERVDKQIFSESILERVYNQIAKADIIVAEMTGRNPNVFYETGYAHALNKQVILLTQEADDVPFNLKHYPHIVYGGKIAALKAKLETRVRWCIENPKRPLTKVDWRLELFVNGTPLLGTPRINIPQGGPPVMRDRYYSLSIGIHNPTKGIIASETFDLAIAIPPGVRPEDGVRNYIIQPDGGVLGSLHQVSSLFPDGWDGISFGFRIDDNTFSEGIPMTLRLFKEMGPEEYPFIVHLVYVR